MTPTLVANALAAKPDADVAQKEAALSQKMAAAGVVADCIAEAELLTDDSELMNLAQASLTAANNLAPATVTDFSLAFSGLKVALRFDLHDHPLPTPEERQGPDRSGTERQFSRPSS